MRNSIVPRRLQVLALLVLLTAPVLTKAQPPDNPVLLSGPQPEAQPENLPLLQLPLHDWLQQNGGLTSLKLQMQNATASEIADALQEQTGLDVEITDDMALPAENPPRFSVESAGQPLWEAIAVWKRGARALGLKESSYQGRWTLSPWNMEPEGTSVSAGPCFMSAHRLSVERAANLSTQNKLVDTSNFLSVSVSVRIDPKFAPQVLALAPQMESAVDDKGRGVPLANHAQLEWGHGSNINMNIQMEAPASDAKSLRSVKGILRLAVQTQGARWELNLADDAPQEKSFRGDTSQVAVRLEKLEAQGNEWIIKLSYEQRMLGTPRVFRSRHNDWSGDLSDAFQVGGVSVLNARGFKMSGQGGHRDTNFDNRVHKVTMEERYGLAPIPNTAPAKIIIDLPLEWREVQIPFEFKDLPLP